MRAAYLGDSGVPLEREQFEGTITFLLCRVAMSPEQSERSGTPSVVRFADLSRPCVNEHGGRLRLDGDDPACAIATFARASAATAAAVAIYRAVSRTAEHDDRLAIRMAIHTGDAERDDEGRYTGHAIAHARNLCDAAHVDQILVSGVTADIIGDGLPGGCQLIDLGTYWLKDQQRRRRVCQLAHADLPRSFPPLGALATIPNNLPVPSTSFIGRGSERAEVQYLLSRERQLTLTGAGGCGKTRLAAAVGSDLAPRFPDGIWWVDLSSVSDEELVPNAVMAALDIGDTRGMRPADRIVTHLEDGSALLILDNCEQAPRACGELTSTLLASCHSLTVMTTSRVALGIDEETVWRVPPLSLPVEGIPIEAESLTAYDAVQLFIDRASEARPNFRVTDETASLIAQICARLDGIPLAIELAAARVRMLSLEAILAGLDDRFRLLTASDAETIPRHETLLASLRWSYDLLSATERAVLRRSSVFAGGFVLDAGERVCSGNGVEELEILDVLGQLVDKSMVSVDEASSDRYRLLESVREFASDILDDAGETAATRDRHLDFLIELAERIAPQIERTTDAPALERFESERENFHAALEWAIEHGAAEDALRLAGALAYPWGLRGHYWEAQTWLRRALSADGAASTAARAQATWGLGYVSLMAMDVTTGFGYASLEDGLALAREAGADSIVARALAALSFIESLLLPQEAEARLAEAVSVARASGDDVGFATALGARAVVAALFQDHHDDAQPLFSKMRTVAERIGNRHVLAVCEAGTGAADVRRGRYRDARSALELALAAARDIGDPVVEMLTADLLADVEIAEGHFDAAKRVVQESGDRLRRSARGRIEAVELRLAAALLAEADIAAAKQLCDALVQPVGELGTNPYYAAQLSLLSGRISIESKEPDAAREHIEQALGLARVLDNPWLTASSLHVSGLLHRSEDEPDKAEEQHHQAIAIQMQSGFLPAAIDSLQAIAGLAAYGESWAEAVRLFAAADSARSALGGVTAPVDQRRCASDLDAARSALGDEAFAAAWAEGAQLSFEQAWAYAGRARGQRRRPSSGWGSLTPTEIDVVRLAKQGLTNPEIAKRMFVTRATVKTHLAHIYAKVGVSSRAELAAEATRRGV